MTRTGYHGHKTLIDGTQVPLSEDEAKALWQAVEAAQGKRAADMPTAEDALRMLISAQERLKELGWWLGGGLKVRPGDYCAVAQAGSTGMWSGWVDEAGEYVYFGDCVTKPREAWLKPLADLTDDERRHMADCDASVAEAFAAEVQRYAALSSPTLNSEDK